jgi:hypothetical protein
VKRLFFFYARDTMNIKRRRVLMKNSIFLRRKMKLIVEVGEHQLPDTYLATALKNLEGLGYTFSESLMDRVRTLSVEMFSELYTQLVQDLKRQVGANVHYKPMYPNFPDQVMNADDCMLYINAILHYLSFQLPDFEEKKRIPLLDNVNLNVIDLGDQNEFDQMICNLLKSKTSLSQTDKEDIEWVIANYDNLEPIIPSEIPLKENLAFLAATLLKHRKTQIKYLSSLFKTATDVLRLATALSGGDISLATNTKFRKFSRPERRFLLSILENCSNITEDMARYKNQWLRLGEILHPGEERNKFQNCKKAFKILRNTKKIQTFNSKIEMMLENDDIQGAIHLLMDRPGMFARKLDYLLRKAEDCQTVINKFAEVADKVSTPVLLQVMTHFAHRNHIGNVRTIFPKGNIAKAVVIENQLPYIEKDVCENIVNVCKNAMVQRFSQMPSLGKVYLDERLQQYVVPFSQRSASKALRTIARGSKLTIPVGDTIRFFVWWKEGVVNNVPTGRVDLDLSAVFYDKHWNYVQHISYTNLKTGYAFHSGDVVSAPNGACEFIDLDIPSLLYNGCRYVMMSVHSFSDQPFCNLPECYAGWMVRQYPQSGEIFEPATVQNKIDITANTQVCIPVIMDLEERKAIWADVALKKNIYRYNNIEGNQKGLISMGKAFTNLVKPNLYDLFTLHVAARGTLTDNIETADNVFSVEKGITPFDIEIIMAEFL